jgi:serine carboxypeptidase-like clade 2
MAVDNVIAIVGWFAKFPEFKKNDLYISVESYAGIYVPYTVNAIHHHNAVHTRDPTIFKPNLKGMMVGNGCTNWKYDTEPAYMEMAYYHSLYSGETWDAIQSNNCLDEYYNANWKNATLSDTC